MGVNLRIEERKNYDKEQRDILLSVYKSTFGGVEHALV